MLILTLPLHRGAQLRRPGFTLMELLVVVSVIGVLMGLLLPSLSAARDKAKSMTCAAGVRQIGNAIATYAARYDGRYPVAYDGASGIGWDDLLYETLADPIPWTELRGNGWLPQRALKIFYCPAAPAFLPLIQGNQITQCYCMPGFNYTARPNTNRYTFVGEACFGMVDYVNFDPLALSTSARLQYRTDATLPDPTGTMMLGEMLAPYANGMGNQGGRNFMWNVDMQINGYYLPQAPAVTKQLHNNQLNYLMADCHVETHHYASKEVIGTGTIFDPRGMWMVEPGDR